jgi:hypothetical protein
MSCALQEKPHDPPRASAYSVHTFAELEAIRDPHKAGRLAEFARSRIETKRGDFHKQIENVKVICADLVELLDIMDRDNATHLEVDTRGLSGRLRLVENELLSATDALADQIGLVAM